MTNTFRKKGFTQPNLNTCKSGAGFTLIELLVVIAIIGLLASVIIVSMQSSKDRARIANLLSYSATIKHSLGADIVGEWRFEESGDNTCTGAAPGYDDFCDDSGQRNHGKNNNVSRVQNDIYQLGKAGKFDGPSYSVLITDSNSLDLKSGITIEAWVKINDLSVSSVTVLSKNYAYIFWYIGGTQRLLRFYTVIKGTGTTLECIPPFRQGVWHHLTATYNGSKKQMFVDGNEICPPQNATGDIDQNTNLLSLGMFSGNIDEVRIYERGLTAFEIQKHYAEGAKKRGIAIND